MRLKFAALILALLAAPLAVDGEQVKRIPRIGVLVPAEPASPTEPHVAAFRQALRELGYVDGRNIVVEYRYAHGRVELYTELAAELARLKVDVMVVRSTAPTRAAKNATQTIPIVDVGMAADPVAAGLVASLSRPGGNVTGLAYLSGGEFYGKCVELLQEAAPQITRVGYVRNARAPLNPLILNALQTVTRALDLKLELLEVHEVRELDRLLAQMSKEPGGSLFVPAQPLLFPHRSQLPELAAKHRLPAMYNVGVFVDAGGLMSYGPSLPDLWRRAATYVDRILKGARPGDLPVEQPTTFEFVINLKTAKALGLMIPQSVLVRADQLIE